jgi:hypothetical protein
MIVILALSVSVPQNNEIRRVLSESEMKHKRILRDQSRSRIRVLSLKFFRQMPVGEQKNVL